MATILLTVNGERRTVDVAPDTPLLWVLRDTLALVGTKFGCGQALCGACTVHVAGVARRACCTCPVSEVGTRPITTIEGLSADGGHPLQRAWIQADVPQCGWCQAGQIMSAAALLTTTPDPSDDQIGQALQGNLCRCGTYLRIRQAVRLAADLARANRGAR